MSARQSVSEGMLDVAVDSLVLTHRSQHFAELYREAMKASEPDVPAILAFRRFYEGRVD